MKWHKFLYVERARKVTFVERLSTIAAAVPPNQRRELRALIAEHEQWIDEIDKVLDGRAIGKERAEESSQAVERVATLTPDEREVLIALVSGLSNKQIAEKLQMALPLVESQRDKLMAKIGAGATADAVRIGIYAGLDENAELPSSLDEH